MKLIEINLKSDSIPLSKLAKYEQLHLQSKSKPDRLPGFIIIVGNKVKSYRMSKGHTSDNLEDAIKHYRNDYTFCAIRDGKVIPIDIDGASTIDGYNNHMPFLIKKNDNIVGFIEYVPEHNVYTNRICPVIRPEYACADIKELIKILNGDGYLIYKQIE